MPAKKSKAIRAKKSAGWKQWRNLANAKTIRRVTATPSARALIIAIICVMGAGVLFASRHPADTTTPAVNGSDKTLAANAMGPYAPIAEPESTSFPPMASVTITGCLEQKDESFRLKDTAGADAPKARSWKSGFIKKSSSPIEVVDANRKLKLPTHVGERVSVTGVLMNREMQVRSLQRVANACN